MGPSPMPPSMHFRMPPFYGPILKIRSLDVKLRNVGVRNLLGSRASSFASATSFESNEMRAMHVPGERLTRNSTYASTAGRGTSLVTASVREEANGTKKRVLFLCLGNICRSPTAEAVFKSVVEREGMSHLFEIDSCGTGGGNPSWYVDGGWSYHEGNPADSRMTTVAASRGVNLTSISRPLKPEDMDRFDMIIGMDPNNKLAIETAVKYWHSQGHLEKGSYEDKIKLMCEFLSDKYKQYDEVPDPYFGGMQGFELVLDLLDDACVGLLAQLKEESMD